MKHRLSQWAGRLRPAADNTSHLEKWLSSLGGLFGVLGVMLVSPALLAAPAASLSLIVASMGATAVLLFAMPHGHMSQPWPVLGGHLVSAAIGVACARWLPDMQLAAALAVALAIGLMHYLRCLHPPGGATALTAVIGGDSIHALGFQFLATPVLANLAMILLIAVLFNYAFPWRRYPLALYLRGRRGDGSAAHGGAPGD